MPPQQCKKCDAMILEVTARLNAGCCGVCAKKKARHLFIASLRELSGCLIQAPLLPFQAIYLLLRHWIRKWRFPYDQSALLRAIQEVHPDSGAARVYLNGVIDGYWECAPESCLFSRHPLKSIGRQDGGRLRRSEIQITAIPTYRTKVASVNIKPGARHQNDQT